MDPQTWAKLQELFSKKLTLQNDVQQRQQALDTAQDDEKSDLQDHLEGSRAALLELYREELQLQTQLISGGGTAPGSTLPAMSETTDKIPGSELSDSDSDREESTTVKYTFKLTRPDKYKEGNNFADFCADFKEHVQLTRMKDDNLSTYFINLLDAPTKKKLRKAVLTPAQRRDSDKFIPIFRRKMMPPHEAENLQMDFSDLSQKANESIEAFAHRVEDTASLAFAEDSTANVNDQCFSAFVKGLSDTTLRIQLRENSIRKFTAAVEEAIRRHGIRQAEERRRAPEREHETPEEVYRIQPDSQHRDNRHQEAAAQGSSSNQHSYKRGGRGGARHNGNSDSRDRAEKNAGKLCHYCKQPNHFTKHCLLNPLNY